MKDNPFEKHDKQKMFRLMLDYRCGHSINADDPMLITYSFRQLRDYLNTLTEEQLDQQVQTLGEHSSIGKPVRLEPVYGAGTVEEMCHVEGEALTQTRSAIDFQHHPEQVVLLRDAAPYSEDGDNFYTMVEDGFIGNKTGKFKPWIKRGAYEPSMKASRSPNMQPQLPQTKDELEASLEALCEKSANGTLTEDEKGSIDSLLAELYRRKYHLTPKGQENDDIEFEDEDDE